MSVNWFWFLGFWTAFYYWQLSSKFSSNDLFRKLRPILSSIGTFNYNLARFLCDLLSRLVTNDYSCKDTFSFVSQIKNTNLSRKFLVSCDVTSLFRCHWKTTFGEEESGEWGRVLEKKTKTNRGDGVLACVYVRLF